MQPVQSSTPTLVATATPIVNPQVFVVNAMFPTPYTHTGTTIENTHDQTLV
jgi:hypothetical protein